MKKTFILFLAICFLGCAGDRAEEMTENRIEVINAQKLLNKIADRDDKLLFLNVWATWCVPCVEEFPDIIKIAEEYKGEVDFVSLNVNTISEIDTDVKPFLDQIGSQIKTYIVDENDSESVINLLNREWSGALPATFIYDKNGIQKKFILGAANYKEFKQSIDIILQVK